MAGSKTYRVLATVLDKTKLKETDLILTLLLEDGRQVGAVAKGARKPGSRLSARCELFCSVDVLLARGRNLDIITQADLIEAPLGPAPSYEATCSASAIAEIAKHCSFEDAKDPFVSAITRKALTYVGSEELTEPHRDLIVAAYVFKLLSHVGIAPIFQVACIAATMRSRISPLLPAACFARAAPRAWRAQNRSIPTRSNGFGRLSPARSMGSHLPLSTLRLRSFCLPTPTFGPRRILTAGFVPSSSYWADSAPFMQFLRACPPVVSYRPVGTPILDARFTGGFSARGEFRIALAIQEER